MSKIIKYLNAKAEQYDRQIVLICAAVIVVILFACLYVVASYIAPYTPYHASDLIFFFCFVWLVYVVGKAIVKDYKKFVS
jgi:hypothetical protein